MTKLEPQSGTKVNAGRKRGKNSVAMRNIVRTQKMSPWAIKVENYLLLLQKEELVDLLRTAGQSVSALKHRPPEKIRQTLLALPQEILAMALRERVRQENRRSTN